MPRKKIQRHYANVYLVGASKANVVLAHQHLKAIPQLQVSRAYKVSQQDIREMQYAAGGEVTERDFTIFPNAEAPHAFQVQIAAGPTADRIVDAVSKLIDEQHWPVVPLWLRQERVHRTTDVAKSLRYANTRIIEDKPKPKPKKKPAK